MQVPNHLIAARVRKIVTEMAQDYDRGGFGGKIEQIKAVRAEFGFPLKLSKDLVEAVNPPPAIDPVLTVLDNYDEQGPF